MVAETEIVCQQSIQVVLDVDHQYRCVVANNNNNNIKGGGGGGGGGGDEIQTAPVIFQQIHASVSIPAAVSLPPEEQVLSLDATSDDALQSPIIQFVPTIRSGSFADIGPRNFMEDEHIRIDDLSSHMGSVLKCPTPSAFYGVFDGHGGPEAAAYMKKNALRFLFQDVDFPQTSNGVDVLLEEVENSIREAFLLADLALADECTVSNCTGTTALTAMILGRLLLVANVGDCRAVLCRKGEAIEMSQDHKPIHPSERRRVEQSGGYVEGGYLNGVLSVSRALGDWDMKLPRGSSSPLIADPELCQAVLTEDDEFLILGCDGIWDVISSQQAVNIVRRGLRRHDDPEQSAKDLVMEALCLSTFDNLTVIVICFFPSINKEGSSSSSPTRRRRLKFCGLSTEALCNLKRFL